MIPFLGAYRVIFWIGVAVAIYLGGAYLGWTAATDRLTAKHLTELAERDRAIDEAEAQVLAMEKAAAEQVNTLRDDHAARMDVVRTDLDRALVGLRRAKTAANRQPASRAPAACRDYEAVPSQLSEPDAEFLVRLGAEADAIVQRLTTCQSYIRTLREAFGLDRPVGAPSEGRKGE
jgi:hypothetical protein